MAYHASLAITRHVTRGLSHRNPVHDLLHNRTCATRPLGLKEVNWPGVEFLRCVVRPTRERMLVRIRICRIVKSSPSVLDGKGPDSHSVEVTYSVEEGGM